MFWIERFFAQITIFICAMLCTDSKNVELTRLREEPPREPIPQRGAVTQVVHRFR